jgi:UTP-glucose-1-phosphate uridylyltransferase
MKPTLFVLAAGMGSRYGGLKQLDPLGPGGETIIDYSIYDAINAGFGKVVFVIRKSIESDFKEILLNKYSGKIDVQYVLQEIEYIPAGVQVTPDRTKPWGTGHAVLMADGVINEPFAVINGDDYYGADGFRQMAKALMECKPDDCLLLGYILENTLSDHGSVSRGVCVVDNAGILEDVVERTHIEKVDDKVLFKDFDGQMKEVSSEAIVSMNFWGFTPKFFALLRTEFDKFIRTQGMELKSEFFIPSVVNNLIKANQISCKVLSSRDSWFGVTYQEDRPIVVEKLKKLVTKGVYPTPLW